MTGRDGVAQGLELAGGDVQVGAADAAGFDFEEDLAGAWFGDGQVLDGERVGGDGSGMVQDGGAHHFQISSAERCVRRLRHLREREEVAIGILDPEDLRTAGSRPDAEVILLKAREALAVNAGGSELSGKIGGIAD